MNTSIENYLSELKQQVLTEFEKTVKLYTDDDRGKVLSFADGVAYADGLKLARIGHKLIFPESTNRAKSEDPNELEIFGVVEDIDEFGVKCLVFGEEKFIKQGDEVIFPKELLKIPVSPKMLGRVLDPFGRRLLINYDSSKQTDPKVDWLWWVDKNKTNEGLDKKTKEPRWELVPRPEVLTLPIERKAPGIIDRDKIKKPLQTGIKAIDAMLPIGRGQRMLLIGDRSIGKTAIALDMIINQNKLNKELNGENEKDFSKHKAETTYCIYVGIGKKASEIGKIRKVLEDNNALSYTIIIASMANDPAPLSYISPFTGCTIGEYFRDIGRNALIIYDDLSKHSNAYRQISLILKRPPGREAYPGDIFYLHSRLLERAGVIKKEIGLKDCDDFSKDYEELRKDYTEQYFYEGKNKKPFSSNPDYKPECGGSLTAIPIVETKQGDYSSYIATNIISITDGQIFLNERLKNEGLRPAIDVGLSVSRIGGKAQTNSMRSASARLKEKLAVYREKEKFEKFGMELQDSEKEVMERGKRLLSYFKQKQFLPISDVSLQIFGLFAIQNGYFDVIPNEQKYIERFEILIGESVKNNKFAEMLKQVDDKKITRKLANNKEEKRDADLSDIDFEMLRTLNGRIEEIQIKLFDEMKMVDNDKVLLGINFFSEQYIQQKFPAQEKIWEDTKKGFYYKVFISEKQKIKNQFIKSWLLEKLYDEKESDKLVLIKKLLDDFMKICNEKHSEFKTN